MPYEPRHQHQLGRGVPDPRGVKSKGSRDCGPRTVQMGIDHQTEGELVPSVADIREAMGTPGYQVTNVRDAERAVPTFHAPGRRPLRYRVVRTTGDVRRAVRDGRFVQVCLDYGVFNARAGRTGDPAFEEGHSGGLHGARSRDGEVEWQLYDPLDDERRPEIPDGPRWVRRAHIMAAIEAFAGGRGQAWAGIFYGGQKR